MSAPLIDGYNAAERLLAILIEKEAGGEGLAGQLAVAMTVRNRYSRPRWWGHSHMEIMTKPWQYESVWRRLIAGPILEPLAAAGHEGSDQIRAAAGLWAAINEPVENAHMLWIARGVVGDHFGSYCGGDPTGGATHFYAPALVRPPEWAASDKMIYTTTIGGHKFFRED